MSRIYDALKKLEAERRGGKSNGAPGGNGGNGSGNGKRNGNGRSRWRWLFARAPRREAEPRVTLDFRLGPEVERTRRSLERVGVRLVGSVLNRRRDYIPAFLEELL